MQDAVEPAEGGFDHIGHLTAADGAGLTQIQRQDGRRRVTGGDNLVVDGIELVVVTAQQNHRGTVSGAGEGGNTADAGTGTGNQQNTIFQQISGGYIVLHRNTLIFKTKLVHRPGFDKRQARRPCSQRRKSAGVSQTTSASQVVWL